MTLSQTVYLSAFCIKAASVAGVDAESIILAGIFDGAVEVHVRAATLSVMKKNLAACYPTHVSLFVLLN